jgi:hypothetical protein
MLHSRGRLVERLGRTKNETVPLLWPVAVHCESEASIPLERVRIPRDIPIWKLEAALKCRSCKKGRYAPPVHMIKLTRQREITPYVWVHPDDVITA